MPQPTRRKTKAEEKPADPYANVDVKMIRRGQQIILPDTPEPMSIDSAIDVLHRIKEDDEQAVSVFEIIDAYPLDGAHAMMKAMQRTYGFASAVSKDTWFGKIAPTTVSVEVDYNTHESVIWGSFVIPGIDGRLETHIHQDGGRMLFAIVGSVAKKHQPAVAKLAQLTREIVAQESIYKGKAIRLSSDDDGDLAEGENPKFLDLSKVAEDELIFSDEATQQVRTNLFTPIERTQRCRDLGIPLKRGVLLEGPYGTGKTLCAYVTAKKCVEHGWTFIMIDDVRAIGEALRFAKMYQPAVVFAEDIDRVLKGQRNADMDVVLNTIDGVELKNSEIITILTTNHVRDIHVAMIRPGRLDAVLTIPPPDAKAAERLIRLYSRGLVKSTTKLNKSGKQLAGQIPAVIREVVERAKLFAISRLELDADFELSDTDLVSAAIGMQNHLELLNPKTDAPLTDQQRFGEAMQGMVTDALSNPELRKAIASYRKANGQAAAR